MVITVKDDSVTTTHGYYECPECKAKFYAGGPALHERGCSKDGYEGLVMHVGPQCPEYADAVDDLRPAAFNLGYDDYPQNQNPFGGSEQLMQWYQTGWATARMHESSAFNYKSENYPYGDRQPYKVRILKTVTSDLPFIMLTETAVEGEVYEVYTNSNGAMSVYLPSGKKLGIKPGEFEIVEFYEEFEGSEI